MNRRLVRETHFRSGSLCALAFLLMSGAACFRTVDVSKLHCLDDNGCPSGTYCANGRCVAGQAPMDGGNPDLTGSPGLDGQAGLDGRSATGGAGGGTSGGTGGTGPQDTPAATGGSTSVPDAPIAPDGADAPASLANGTPCTTDGQCSSARCIDGVCCATTCSGCSACSKAMTNQADGTCAPVASGRDPHDTCTDETATMPCGTDGTCDGQGACRKVGAGQKCGQASCSADGNTFTPEPKCDGNGTCATGAAQSCAPYQCAITGCARTCTQDIDCDAGSFCDTTAGTCSQELSPGSPCSTATASRCSSGSCVDGRCCGVASCGTCQSCTGAGGTCVAVMNAEDPDSCTGVSTCNPSGACKTKTGQACTAGTQCLSANCADGVCCDRACTGSCEYCNTAGSAGTCGYVSGAPKAGHPACAGSGACAGTCNATKASCTMPAAETPCRTASCSGGVQTNPASCDGTGTCPTTNQTTPCAPFVCGTTACYTSCSSSSQCVAGAACIGGACQSCATGQSVCGNGCYNLQSDPSHCGNCTTSCSGGTKPCYNGTCVQCLTLADCGSGYQACNTGHNCVCRQKNSANLLQNPGFDGSMSPWIPRAGAAFVTDDVDNCPGSGSVSLPTLGDSLSQCVDIGENVFYNLGLRFKITGSCWTSCHSDSRCDPAYSLGESVSIFDDGGNPDTWSSRYASGTTPAGTKSLLVNCSSPVGPSIVDQVYLNTGSASF